MTPGLNSIDELRSALEYPSTPVRPDTAAIIGRARHRRAVQRAALGGGAFTVIALAAAGIVAVAGPSAGTRPGPGAGPVPAAGIDAAPNAVLVAAVSGAPPTAAPARFDPTVRTLHVGTIPAGLTEQSAETGPLQQAYFATTAGGHTGIGVIILAAGQPASRLPSGQLGMPLDASSAVALPTAPINGRPAQCLHDPAVAGSCAVLLWQYAPGAWARASYAPPAGTSIGDATAAARRMAESVALTAGDPVRLPYRLTGPLAALKVAGTAVSVDDRGTGTGHPTWGGQVSLVDNDADIPATQLGGKGLTVAFSRIDPQADPGHTANQVPNTTVDGHPAWLDTDGQSLVVHLTDDALRVYLGYVDRAGSVRAGFAALQLVDTPDDLGRWVSITA